MLPTLAPPAGVTSTSVISADLGANQLLVISGIAIPDWNINDNNLHRDTVQVQLGVYALTIEVATVDVALCSIANDNSNTATSPLPSTRYASTFPRAAK